MLTDVLPGDVWPPPQKPSNAKQSHSVVKNPAIMRAISFSFSTTLAPAQTLFVRSGMIMSCEEPDVPRGIAAEAITCCDRDTEASFSLQEAD